jgi:hypothetical protein
MWDFSGDEVVFMIVACAAALIGFAWWYFNIARSGRWRADRRCQVVLAGAPLVALLVLFVVLQTLADPVYVAGHLDYMLLFLAGGAMWMFVWTGLVALCGVSARHDALEGRNFAAAVALAGGMLGLMLSYAGSNIGNGPTIWTTLVPAAVAALSLLALWVVLALVGPVHDAITVDHDLSAAVRLAAFLVGAGAILGRAMAGDWHGYAETWTEFARLAWPVLLLLLLAATMNRIGAPTPVNPRPSVVTAGVVPGLIILLLAGAYVMCRGWPEVAPPGRYEP